MTVSAPKKPKKLKGKGLQDFGGDDFKKGIHEDMPDSFLEKDTVGARRKRRGRLFKRLVRNRITFLLVRDKNYVEEEAEDLVDSLDDDTIDDMADHQKVEDLGDGSFLQKIIDFITSEKFMQLIQALMALLLMFAKPKMNRSGPAGNKLFCRK